MHKDTKTKILAIISAFIFYGAVVYVSETWSSSTDDVSEHKNNVVEYFETKAVDYTTCKMNGMMEQADKFRQIFDPDRPKSKDELKELRDVEDKYDKKYREERRKYKEIQDKENKEFWDDIKNRRLEKEAREAQERYDKHCEYDLRRSEDEAKQAREAEKERVKQTLKKYEEEEKRREFKREKKELKEKMADFKASQAKKAYELDKDSRDRGVPEYQRRADLERFNNDERNRFAQQLIADREKKQQDDWNRERMSHAKQ